MNVRKMASKSSAFLMVLVLMLALFPTVSLAADTIADGTYTYTDDMQLYYASGSGVTVTVTVSGGKFSSVTATADSGQWRDEYVLENMVYSLNNTLSGQTATISAINNATYNSSGVPRSGFSSDSSNAFGDFKSIVVAAINGDSGSDAGKTIKTGKSATIYVGETVTLQGGNGYSYNGYTVTWNYDSNYFQITDQNDGTGYSTASYVTIKGLKATDGAKTITQTVTYYGYTYYTNTYNVTVLQNGDPSSINLDKESVDIVKGKTSTVTATPDGCTVTEAVSDDTSVVTVQLNGDVITVTGIAAGTATVTVKGSGLDGYSDPEDVTFTVTVTEVLDHVKSYDAESKSIQLNVTGKSITTTETVEGQTAMITPIDVVLVLDNTTSMSTAYGNTSRIAALRTAAKKFVDGLPESSESNISMVSFVCGNYTSTPTVDVDWTTLSSAGKSKVDSKIDTLTAPSIQSGYDTYFGPGISTTKSQLEKSSVKNDGNKKYVVFFTDGSAAESVSTIQTAAAQVHALADTVFSIGIVSGDTETEKAKALASDSNYYFDVSKAGTMSDAFTSAMQTVVSETQTYIVPASGIVISDTLSSYVDLSNGSSDNYGVTVKAGSNTVDSDDYTVTYDSSAKKITVTFDSNYELEEEMVYTVSIPVSPSASAQAEANASDSASITRPTNEKADLSYKYGAGDSKTVSYEESPTIEIYKENTDSSVTVDKTAEPVSGTDDQFDITLTINTVETASSTELQTLINSYLSTADFVYGTSKPYKNSSAVTGTILKTNGNAPETDLRDLRSSTGNKSVTIKLYNSNGTNIANYTVKTNANNYHAYLVLEEKQTYLPIGGAPYGNNTANGIQNGDTLNITLSDSDLDYLMTKVYEKTTTTTSSNITLNKVVDTLPEYIKYVNDQSVKSGSTSVSGQVITWSPISDNPDATVTTQTSTSGNTTTTTVTTTNRAVYTYRVKVDTTASGFKYDTDLPANLSAVLTYNDDETKTFPVPTVNVLGPSTFTLVHVRNDGTENITEELPVPEDAINLPKDYVKTGYLYGGLFTDSMDCKTPSATPGTKFEPEAGKTYYMREVDSNYLIVRNVYLTYAGNVIGSYGMTVVDDNKYKEVGFLYSGKSDPVVSGYKETSCTLYNSVKYPYLNGDPEGQTFEPKDIFSQDGSKTPASTAKIAVGQLDSAANGTVQAYWITADNVLVTGDNIRTLEGGMKKSDTTGNIGAVENPYTTTSYQENGLPVKAMYVAAEEDEEENIETGVKLAGYTTSLNGKIEMNFYLELSDEVAADHDAEMRFTLPGSNHTDEVVKLSDARKQVRGDKTYYVFSAGVAAKDMTSDIKAQFVQSNGTKSEVWIYTIKAYCDYIRNHPDSYDETSVALVENMLNYGGYAQTYFNYNTSKLANADLDLDLPTVELDDSFDAVISGGCDGLTYLGSSAMLTTTTGLRHYFELNNAEVYTFKANGKELEVQADNNGSYVLINNIKAKDLRKPVTLTVTDSEGNEFSLSYSVYTNIKQVVGNEDFSEASRNLMKALYGYGEAANDYFASRS